MRRSQRYTSPRSAALPTRLERRKPHTAKAKQPIPATANSGFHQLVATRDHTIAMVGPSAATAAALSIVRLGGCVESANKRTHRARMSRPPWNQTWVENAVLAPTPSAGLER